ncbi:MAG: BamA/TamA family outer membrane protein [Deltaproteobacteria bacterium]|nr:BamA/TamA family outer membrane protein [Deltaproteobacteria bacterium]
MSRVVSAASVMALLFIAASAQAEGDAPKPDRYEVSALPVLFGDTDRGVILGVYGVVVRFQRGYSPYRWRLRVSSRLSVVRRADDTLSLPFHDHVIRLDLPGFLHPRLRVDAEVAFRRYAATGYYGVGNASPDGRANTIPDFTQYIRTHPGALLKGRWRFTRRLSLLLGAAFTYNWIGVTSGSKLAEDLNARDARLDDLLRGTSDHASLILTLGWLWDTRDQEFAPTRGMFHEISWRLSPGVEFLFGGLNVTSRFFYPIFGERLVVAGRLVLDMLFGDAPVYELSRLGGLLPQDGVGGSRGVRGVPLQRYHGKIKVLGNLELRSKLLPFTLLSQRFNLGALAFVDLGRIWSDYHAERRFDGTGIGLEIGVGGGIRLQWGETFILRADVAWSPDADPVGAYFGFSHIF